ncbi:TATA box-binding protein-associated factor RNA polymerase I subunit B [Phoenix dactylifera]|uniref:TATA box-binding protein-associated factor RNA polymerase I subunit B n=1 Tax=Phoenix dactylifera TaxID=42345 RepID=A0A8B7BZT0_PHODC|nr:TATA box-binding protein-associated factor RNA polymerase I subunit B [Phoenix dactylifera]
MENHGWSSPFSAAKREPEAAGGGLYCDGCGGREFEAGDDGFFYCQQCGSQSQEVVATGCADEDILGDGSGTGAVYSLFHHRARKKSDAPSAAPKISRDELLRSLTQSLSGSARKREEAEPSAARPYGFDDETSEPRDFGSGPWPDAETLAGGIRLRYVQGMQVMIQLQCEALVERFGVSPLICGIVGDIWLRYLAASRVFDEKWVEKVIAESEAAAAASTNSRNGEPEWQKPSKHIKAKYKMEPRNSYGQRAIYIWFRSMRKTIPVYSSLAICFLVCHIAREAILPTDICKWALEGKLPYLAAFVELDKYLGSPSNACPLSTRFLFRPVQAIGAWHLEAAAGSIAQNIGLRLPSVNFYAIACRYSKELTLPLEKIIPHACRLYEWSIPAELWLSSNASRIPTRVCVMSILIVTIRILYNIHGQGIWEMSLSDCDSSPSCYPRVNHNLDEQKSSSAPNFEVKGGDAKESSRTTGSSPKNKLLHNKAAEFDTKELLGILEAAYDKISDAHDYSKDLQSYLKYCKDIIFAGITTSYDEEILIERLWNIYDKQEVDNLQEDVKFEFLDLKGKRLRDEVPSSELIDSKKPREDSKSSQNEGIGRSDTPMDSKLTTRYEFLRNDSGLQGKHPVCGTSTSSKSSTLEKMKINMEENGFQYLPPRIHQRTDDYLHYGRKRVDGKLIYVAHADYYIILRACSKLAQVDVRIMHLSVLKFERRLAWIEQQIESSLNSLTERTATMTSLEAEEVC